MFNYNAEYGFTIVYNMFFVQGKVVGDVVSEIPLKNIHSTFHENPVPSIWFARN